MITIPSGVTVIGEEAFQSCYDFAAVNVDASNTVYASVDGVLYNKAKTELLYYPGAKEILSHVIPDGVTTIGRNAFADARFTSVVLPAYVAKIKMGAFYCNSLEQITILNLQCEIGETDAEGEPMAGTVISLNAIIRGHEGSTAQAYAQQNENPFEVISEETCTHEYVEQVTTPATCQQKGVKTFTCKKCGDSYTEEIPMISHTYGEAVIVQSTCTKAGTKTYTCSVCGHSESEEFPLAEHMYKTETQKAAPGKDGSIQTKCSVCGEVSAKQAISSPQVVGLSKSTVTYNGKAQSVAVTVKDSAGKVIPAANYSVAYSNNTRMWARFL